MTREIAILDFGSGRITAAVGSRGAADSLVLRGFAQVEYQGFKSGEFLRPENLSQAVQEAVSAAQSEAGVSIKHLYIGVPAEFSACVVREVSSSLGKRHKINQSDVEKLLLGGADFSADAAGYTVINRQPIYYTLDDERRVIDPVGMVSGKLTGLISYILAENKFTFFIDNIMERLGIDSAEYVSAPLAEAMFLLPEEKRDRSAVLVDIGYITSSVAVVRGDGLLSLGSFSLGGGHISADFTQYFGIPFAHAEALKRKVMVSLQPKDGDAYEIKDKQFDASLVNKIVSARLEVLAKGIQKCLAQNKFEVPDTAVYYLTGGGVSYMRGARQQLAQYLGRDIELLTPPIPQMEQPELSSALGLLDIVLDADIPEKKKKKGFWAKLLGG